MTIDFETACVEFTCERCNGTGIDPVRIDHDPDWCTGCGGSQVHVVYIGTWLANLAIGAALCRADALGYERCATIDYWNEKTEPWRPGCGKAAP